MRAWALADTRTAIANAEPTSERRQNDVAELLTRLPPGYGLSGDRAPPFSTCQLTSLMKMALEISRLSKSRVVARLNSSIEGASCPVSIGPSR